MLEVTDIDVGYGVVPVLRGVSLTVAPGTVHCLVGRNGAGKTTLMKAVMGLLPLGAGLITLDGAKISGQPAHLIPGRGIGYVPQGRRLFGSLTVAENLAVGLYARGGTTGAALAHFPRLTERLTQRADTLSGGEQTMLAVARALCLNPLVILMDEPTEGLQPSMVAAIREVTLTLARAGKAVLLVEQRIDAVLAVADQVSFIEAGRITGTMTGDKARADPAVLRARLGV
jgi:branched-chain amino acid transport system ATP-binding protein